MKKSQFAAAFLAISSVSLVACGESEVETPAEAPDGIADLEITNARMVLAPVAGNPAAVYFDMTYNGDRNVSIRRVDVAGAESAVMHKMGEWDRKVTMMEMGPMAVKKGEAYTFEPGGNHVMAMGVSPDLQPGGTAEVTLTIAGGDKHSFDAEIRGAGEER